MWGNACGGKRTTLWSLLPPSTLSWVLVVKLRFPGLRLASVFILWTILSDSGVRFYLNVKGFCHPDRIQSHLFKGKLGCYGYIYFSLKSWDFIWIKWDFIWMLKVSITQTELRAIYLKECWGVMFSFLWKLDLMIILFNSRSSWRTIRERNIFRKPHSKSDRYRWVVSLSLGNWLIDKPKQC